MRLVLVADDVVADGAHELAMPVELEELRLTRSVALEREEMPFGVDRDRRDPAAAFRQRERVGERELKIGRAKLV